MFADMASLRPLEPRHTLRVPLTLWGYVSELNHGVGSNCGVMMSHTVISPIFVSISSLTSMGTLFLLYCTVVTLGSIVMRVFARHVAYLVEGIQESVLQIFDAVDSFMEL